MGNGPRPVDREMLRTIETHAGVGIGVGILVAVGGLLALLAPLAAGLAIAVAIGFLLLIGGVSRLFLAFRMGSLGHGAWMLAIAFVSIVAGVAMVFRPAMALETLTLVLAAYFVVDGAFEMIWALRLRPIRGWGWTLFSGVIALALGAMIWQQFPVSGAWAVGTLAGIHMIFGGSSVASVCSAAKSAAKEAQAT